MSGTTPHDPNGNEPVVARSFLIEKPFFRTLTSRVDFVRAAKQPTPSREPTRRPAKVAQMLALAHHLQNAIDEDDSLDQSTVAKRLGVTKARITQLLDLTLLAPDLQEQVLAMEAVDGVEPMSELAVRKVAQIREWSEQRRRWVGVCGARRDATPTVPGST